MSKVKKFKIQVVRIHYEERVVHAVDYEHALEIASDFEEYMESSQHNFLESNWKAVICSNDEIVTYIPDDIALSVAEWEK